MQIFTVKTGYTCGEHKTGWLASTSARELPELYTLSSYLKS